jgi:hypothetical protein
MQRQYGWANGYAHDRHGGIPFSPSAQFRRPKIQMPGRIAK